MVTIIFESHGSTFDNEQNLASGHFDVGLSELGRQQAAELGKRYAKRNFDAIFCSDLKRAWETAEIAFRDGNATIVRDSRLREVDYGDLTKGPAEEIENLKGKHVSVPFPNGQSYEQTTRLIKSFLEGLLNEYDGKEVMIIGHRATQYGLEHLINKVPLAETVTASWQWQPGWIYYLNNL